MVNKKSIVNIEGLRSLEFSICCCYIRYRLFTERILYKRYAMVECVCSMSIYLFFFQISNFIFIFLSYLPADDFSTQHSQGEAVPCAGLSAIIPKENCNKFFPLQIIKCYEKDICAVSSWDSSIHDNVHLNRITQSKFKEFNFLKWLKYIFFCDLLVYHNDSKASRLWGGC